MIARTTILILCGSLLLCGCQTVSDSPSESHYEQVERQIEQLKAQTATSTGSNIKIVVNMLTIDISDHSAIETLWRYADENAVIAKRPEIFAASGLRLGIANKNFRARINITKQQLKSSEETELFIVLADGTEGYIYIGKEIAVPRFYYWGRWYRAIDYDFQHAGRSLKVTATKLPSGLITLELTPVFSKFLNDGGDIELTELSTKVTLLPEQTIVLGGTTASAENVATALLGYHKGSEKKETLITVTAYII